MNEIGSHKQQEVKEPEPGVGWSARKIDCEKNDSKGHTLVLASASSMIPKPRETDAVVIGVLGELSPESMKRDQQLEYSLTRCFC